MKRKITYRICVKKIYACNFLGLVVYQMKITSLRYIIFTSLVGVNSLSLLMFDRQLAGCLGQPKDFRSTCTFNLSKDSSMYAHLSRKTICKGKDNIILLPFCNMFYYFHFVICFIFIYN